jgi:hypothetical protein
LRSLLAAAIGVGVPIGIGAAVACGPPASFDHITGKPPIDAAAVGDAPTGTLTKDPTLDPPRPLAPLSTSIINGPRPHFRWELAPSGVGAQVIVCGDRACSDASKKKVWSAAGTELDAPEDLPPGVWFWKLVTTTAGTVGDEANAKSIPWSFVIRAGNGSGMPTGQFVDPNGDGMADLFVSTEAPPGSIDYPVHGYMYFEGSSLTDPSALKTALADYSTGLYADTVDAPIITTDVDGDGLTDIAIASQGMIPPQTVIAPYVAIAKGDLKQAISASSVLTPPIIPNLDVIPALAAPGDLDGDGHGDLLVTTKVLVGAVFGATDGASTVTFFDVLNQTAPPDSGFLPPPSQPIAITGVDFDSDGLGDVAWASYFVGAPLAVFKGNLASRDFTPVDLRLDPKLPTTTPPTAIASGDFDGDGKTDIAFVTTFGGKNAVCALYGSAPLTDAGLSCWVPDPTPPGFAASLAAADLDGIDGKEEILVGSANGGFDILTPDAPTTLKAEHITSDYGAGISVIHPGRPTPAAWAATRADGTSFAIFSGKTQKTVVLAKDFPFITKFGKAIR